MTEGTVSDAMSDSVSREPIRHPHSIRFTDAEWLLAEEAAALFHVEPAVFVRRLTLKKLAELDPEIERRRQIPKEQELF